MRQQRCNIPSHETLILTPPKSASRSITDALCGRAPYCGWHTIGPSMGERVDHHRTVMPCGYNGFKMLVTVRTVQGWD
jgi:hypothetical protein